MASFFKKYFGNKADFFSCNFDIFYGSIGCATKFHADEIIFFFFFISFDFNVLIMVTLTHEAAMCALNWYQYPNG